MKSGVTRSVGALCVALGAAAIYFHGLPHPREASKANSLAPVATPPGITLQLRAVSGRPPQAADAQVVYADANGMTLYGFDKDIPLGKSTCTGDCAEVWPPAVAPASATHEGDWTLVGRADGMRQWAYRGAPLYRFAHDKAIGDANGDGADGGAWHVAVFQPGAGMVLPDAIEVREIADAGGAGLVDSLGMTLYAFDGDAMHPERSCVPGSACAWRWMPLEAPQIARPAGDFSVIVRDNGITQWAYRGKPLYTFDGDQRAGDVNGIGADAGFRIALIVRHFMPADAMLRRTVQLGSILTTTSGATLYERDRPATDEGHNFRENHGWPALGRSFGTTTCDENCAKSWPPFTAPADALPSGYWDVAQRPDGRRQWVYKGYALYTYAADQPGDISGNELYDLAQVGEDDAGVLLASNHRGHAAPGGGAAGEDPLVPSGGDVAGIGVGAMFWHAVVP